MRNIILALILVIAAFLVMDFNSRMTELKHLEAEKEVVQEHLNSRLSTKSALTTQIAHANSDMAVIEWAYQNHMAREGDIPVIPIEINQATPTPTPRPSVTPTEMNNFQEWLSLFFDRKE
jgi:hypothetical protein